MYKRQVYTGEKLGVVGESGCGKSTLGKSIMRLENPTGGEVLYNFDGEFKDIMRFDRQELFQFRKRVQMVFQDPYSALNPVKRVYDSFSEPLKVHGYKSAEEQMCIRDRCCSASCARPRSSSVRCRRWCHPPGGTRCP